MSSLLDSLVERARTGVRAKGALDNHPGTGKAMPPETFARSAWDDPTARPVSCAINAPVEVRSLARGAAEKTP